MKKVLIAFFCLGLVNSFAQDRRVITTAVPFLMISSDARASGIGEQGVATSVDYFSQNWNPSKYVFSVAPLICTSSLPPNVSQKPYICM